ncbi:PREDICTED: carnosine N-methyltransferase isoform X2 [Nicrophorus vespilloides]|uniref:carnosine N-methyltransferase n=1 Tax=Nicrophorus vespilloides TaxID=110193 RepID=A0ABM1N468_NICVS|nr:PREDICTED: carnosine N-methyltransferase isoform X2 [Nicrophorus vespilloides]
MRRPMRGNISCRCYKHFKVTGKHQSMLRIEHREECLATLPSRHKKWLSKYKTDLEGFKKAVDTNASFVPIVVEHAKNIFENVCSQDGTTHSETEVGTLSEGLDKVQSVFKHLMRDWSTFGAEEREQCYNPIIEEIEAQFPAETSNRADINILVPGAGLGRLAFEIASRGFSCQGNEFNLFMLIVSFYVLNHCKNVEEFVIFPWIHQYCNNLSAENQMLSVKFPDVLPKLTESQFSMVAGDFLEVYTDCDEWNCIATCFFIDCAANVVQFIETIYEILKPGGVWINLGPLLYHYSDMKNERSIEPSFEILCSVIKNIGFEMEKKEIALKTRYCQNPNAMLQYEYESVFFVCRKPLNVDNCAS